ncbi:hypothetical protein HA402_003337 [Bradysia odoriphaga]|nr:hypothetical protein HA402_003337 [Bradysia odoriphaga]
MCGSIFLLTVFTLFCTTFVHGQSEALFLTPLIASGNISVARNLSLVLPLPNSSPDISSRPSYSGLITVNETNNSNLFFWFFPATAKCNEDDNAPIVLWLDGGPDGIFSLEHRLEDWTVNRSIIYLESPVDVGFSFTSNPAGLPKTSEEAAEDTVEFLRQFFLLFPEYFTNPFYLAGQSYGGHFAPAVGTALHQRNEDNRETRVNFQGMLLMAPWTNPFFQVDSYADYMYQTALIDETARDDFVVKQESIKRLITERKYVEAKDVSTALTSIRRISISHCVKLAI